MIGLSFCNNLQTSAQCRKIRYGVETNSGRTEKKSLSVSSSVVVLLFYFCHILNVVWWKFVYVAVFNLQKEPFKYPDFKQD